jgi:hypothetical protein
VLFLTISLLAIAIMLPSLSINVLAGRPEEWRGVGRARTLLTVYVVNQRLIFDSIITADPLPFNEGNAHTFQQLGPGMFDAAVSTMWGPGDPGYTGGRWWVDDLTPDPGMGTVGEMDEYDHYFSCPLLGPGVAPEV